MDRNDGSRMPLLGFGTFQLVGKACEEAVAAAIGAGYRMIDTAQAYGNEAEVGAAVAASGIAREELFLVTKVDFKAYEDARTAAEGSLRRLRTDYVDLLLLHWPFANYYAAWRAMEALHAEGKVRSIGVSNFTPGQLLDLIAYNEVAPCIVSAGPTGPGWTRRAWHRWPTRPSARGRAARCSRSRSSWPWRRSMRRRRPRSCCAS